MDEDPPSQAPDDFAALRTQCDALISGEHVDKAAALGILKLFQRAETMMLEMRFAKDQELENLRHELRLVQMMNKHNKMLESLASDTTQLRAQFEALRDDHVQQLHRLAGQVQAQQGVVEQLQQGRRR